MADYKNCNGLNGSRWLKEKIFFVINLLYQYWNFKDIISTFDCCFMYKLRYNTYCSTVENAPNCCTVNKNALKLLQMVRYLMYYHQWHETENKQKILVVHQNGILGVSFFPVFHMNEYLSFFSFIKCSECFTEEEFPNWNFLRQNQF